MKPQNIEKAKELCRDLDDLEEQQHSLIREHQNKDTDADSGHRHIELMDRRSYNVSKELYLEIIQMIISEYGDAKDKLTAEIEPL